jgi:glucose-6-phosphate 1-epimerase
LDRVYLSTPPEAYIVDGDRAIRILKMGFPDAVVWNIGSAAAGGIKDMGKDEWKQYVCYEAAVVASPAVVPPASSWNAGQTFTRIAASAVPKAK